MTMEALFNNVENAISQYEQACEQEETLYDMMRDAENDMNRYSSQASSSEEASQAQRYLQATRSELTNVIKSIEEKLPKFDQSISTFEQMASNPFGSSAASQLPQLRARRAEYQQNLNDAYTLVDRIDSALNGGGNSPQLVLRRR